MIEDILLGFCISCLLIFTFLLIRNEWVWAQRRKAIDSGEWDRLPDWNVMLLKFWIWDVKKFLKDK